MYLRDPTSLATVELRPSAPSTSLAFSACSDPLRVKRTPVTRPPSLTSAVTFAPIKTSVQAAAAVSSGSGPAASGVTGRPRACCAACWRARMFRRLGSSGGQNRSLSSSFSSRPRSRCAMPTPPAAAAPAGPVQRQAAPRRPVRCALRPRRRLPRRAGLGARRRRVSPAAVRAST